MRSPFDRALRGAEQVLRDDARQRAQGRREFIVVEIATPHPCPACGSKMRAITDGGELACVACSLIPGAAR